MPVRPTLVDFFNLRFQRTRNHTMQSAALVLKNGVDELDVIGRHFRQPREGLGNDNSPNAHMWRTLANPDAPL
jgi:hypothetical protein